MAQLNYSDIIQTLISNYSTSGGSYAGEVKSDVIFDTKNDRYQLVNIGWNGQRRIYRLSELQQQGKITSLSELDRYELIALL